MAGLFITGTDTGVGKTEVTVALMAWLRQQGVNVVGMKPVACGCVPTEQGLRNEDALKLLDAASSPVTYGEVNPYAFERPIAPHLAARAEACVIDLAALECRCRELERKADGVLVEGVGGWEVPLGEDVRVSHMARALGLPVVLVVGMRLGCLNHALLTHEAILLSGLECAGWIANDLTGCMDYLDENIATLKVELSVPYLGLLQYRKECGSAVGTDGQSPRFTGLMGDEILRRFKG